MKTHIRVLLVLFAVCISSAWSQSYVIVVNKANPMEEISKTDLKRLFTGKRSNLGDLKAVPINLPLNSALASAFLENILGMSSDEYKEFWLAAQVKGNGAAPMIQKSSEGVAAIVSQLPGGIGYIEKEKVTAEVKVIKVN